MDLISLEGVYSWHNHSVPSRLSKEHQFATKRLSLSPLSFDEAVTDILKVKPMPKPPKKKAKSSGTGNDQKDTRSRKKR
jgi:hypothetical protein